ncbi:ADP-ribosylation factor-like protein 2-binding protein [Rhodnius prolixus]|uniref:ADP-ribosylation factor-like protein 2-binding protein n=2 Tax=Rhodnius TaxID=13248 RepID=R4G822_RHOPR
MAQNEFKKMKDLSLHESLEDINISSEAISSFDKTIGFIEDIIVEESFQKIQRQFLEQYWDQFDDGEENRLIYMDIFQNYVKVVERHIEKKLKEAITNFDMGQLYEELRKNQDHLDGEVFEMLYTLSDFSAFKEMILDYKAEKEGKIVDLTKDLSVISLSHPGKINVS